jgi:plastocyanin
MRRLQRGLFCALCALALIAAGCGGDDDDADVAADDDTTTTAGDGDEPSGEANEITVEIDGHVDDFNTSFFAYFPDEVTVHPGDTITYRSNFTGEPHSIAFGTLVEDAVAEFRKLTPEQLESDGPPPPELDAAFAKIPPMLPEGPGDAIQSSVNPCFMATGEPPAEEACEVQEPEPFTGEEAFYNSGFLADEETFELQLADDIEPGTYVGFCTLHFTEMISEVTVVAADEEVPSADEVAEEAEEQKQSLAEQVASGYEEAKAGAGPGAVSAGLGSEEASNVLVVEFLPEDVEVAAGDIVTWTVTGPHTISFNASEELRVLLNRGDDGAYHFNEESVTPAGFDAPPPPEGEPTGPPPPLDAGEWDGTGFLSSGILFFGEFKVAITEPGTYEYVCLIHPDMEGTVTVT